jgi:hypothetical protein
VIGDLETYDNLRGRSHMVPKILGVIVVLDGARNRRIHCEENLALRRCG